MDEVKCLLLTCMPTQCIEQQRKLENIEAKFHRGGGCAGLTDFLVGNYGISFGQLLL